MHGDYDGSSGQITEYLREEAEKAKDDGVDGASDVLRLCELWDSLHLNGMKAGTRAQLHALSQAPALDRANHYEAARGYLAECGLMMDRNTAPEVPNANGKMVRPEYSYGSKWLYKPVAQFRGRGSQGNPRAAIRRPH